MAVSKWHPDQSRNVQERIVFSGHIVLEEPLHIGSGEQEVDEIDLPLLVDASSGAPMLTGDALGGYLRSQLHQRLGGYRNVLGLEEEDNMLLSALFGSERMQEDTRQGVLIVDDAYGTIPEGLHMIVREGIKVNKKWGTAEDKKFFERLCWPPGTCFDISFELLITADYVALRGALIGAMLSILQNMAEDGGLIGARTRRGFGLARLKKVSIQHFDLQVKQGALAWLLREQAPRALAVENIDASFIQKTQEFFGELILLEDRRSYLSLMATFRLAPESGILIGGAEGARIVIENTETMTSADRSHVHSPVFDQGTVRWLPVVPGSTLGALRARAYKIVRTLLNGKQGDENLKRTLRAKGAYFIEQLFGPEFKEEISQFIDEEQDAWASRIAMREAKIERGDTGKVQHHVSLDRHSQGPVEGALYNVNPLLGQAEQDVEGTRITLDILIENPVEEEIGLLLLLLKDLWTGDLPLGADRNEGMGRLWGIQADIKHVDNGEASAYRIGCTDQGQPDFRASSGRYWPRRSLSILPEDRQALERFHQAFIEGVVHAG